MTLWAAGNSASSMLHNLVLHHLFFFPLKRNQCDCIFGTSTTLQSVITSSSYQYKRASQISIWLQAANNTKLHRKLKIIVSAQYSPRQIINANEQSMMICICDQVLATAKIQMPLKCLRLIICVIFKQHDQKQRGSKFIV